MAHIVHLWDQKQGVVLLRDTFFCSDVLIRLIYVKCQMYMQGWWLFMNWSHQTCTPLPSFPAKTFILLLSQHHISSSLSFPFTHHMTWLPLPVCPQTIFFTIICSLVFPFPNFPWFCSRPCKITNTVQKSYKYWIHSDVHPVPTGVARKDCTGHHAVPQIKGHRLKPDGPVQEALSRILQ